MKIAIIANGAVPNLAQVSRLAGSCDLVIAADGGALHCKAAHLVPQVVIGDFDSLSSAELDELEASGAEIIGYPARKNFTDLELALAYACQQTPEQIDILGGLGLRWDQTLANILLLANPAYQTTRVTLVDGSQEIFLVQDGQTREIFGEPGDTVSLLPVNGDAQGVSTQGLEYPLDDEILYFGAARGVSNVLTQQSGSIHIKKGMLICTVIHKEQNR